MSEEAKKELSEKLKKQYENGRQTWNKGLTIEDSRVKNYATKQKITKKLRGTGSLEKNSRWKGGKAIYRKMAIAQKGEKCEICGKEKTTERSIHVHHIDHNKLNNKIENLMVLCTKCHRNKHPQEVSEKQKQALSKRMKGVPKSEEHKKKISETKKRQWKEGVYDFAHLGPKKKIKGEKI